jgi:hypothetical protein
VEDLKTRIKVLLDELEFRHLKKNWVRHLVETGIDEHEARKWAAEIGHVIDEYRSTLIDLADLMMEYDPELILLDVHEWAVNISDVTVPALEDPMRSLEELLEKYLPPDDDFS